MNRFSILTFVVLLLMTSRVEAKLCFEPSAPSLFAIEPNEPYCFTLGNWENWDIQLYRSAWEAYIRKLNNYLEEVEQFGEDADEFAKCKAKLD